MLLFWLIFIPFISSFLCWQCDRLCSYISKWIALCSVLIILFILFILWWKWNSLFINKESLLQWKIEYFVPWIPYLGINIHLALDGLSLLMITLVELLGILSIFCSWSEIKRYHGFFYFNLLWILGSIIGLFMAVDMFLFFFFWETMSIPIYFLITLFGNKFSSSKIRVSVANKFFIYTQISGIIMLVSIVSLVFIHYYSTSILTFSYEDLLHTPMSGYMEYLLMLGFFFSFAIKIPIVPLHGWLPDLHNQTPISGSVDLIGILVKTSSYGMLRFVISLFPHASYQFSSIAMFLGVLSIFYGSCMAFSQTNIKRIIAYTNISHMGFILIAIYSGSQLSYYGAIIQIISCSLSSAGIFIIFGQLHERLNTYDIRKMGGLWNKINFISILSLFFIAAMLGIPGTGNFIGEIIILFGSFQVAPFITIISTFFLVFSSIYLLFVMHYVYYGTNKFTKSISGLTLRERITILPLLFFILFIGIFPTPIINISKTYVNNIQNCLFTHSQYKVLK